MQFKIINMKAMLLPFLFLHTVLSSCSPKANVPVTAKDSTPVCILKRIEEIKKEPVWSPAAEINEYSYAGRTVYLVTANCCDQFITLMDKRCEVLCAPSGGFTGSGDGACPDFYKQAKHLRLVWKDERGQ